MTSFVPYTQLKEDDGVPYLAPRVVDDDQRRSHPPTPPSHAQNPNNAAVDARDYIEFSDPDPILQDHWSCVPIRCRLADEDRKQQSDIGSPAGGSSGNPSTSAFPHSPMTSMGLVWVQSYANASASRSGFPPFAYEAPDPYECRYIVPRQSYFFMHCETILASFKNVVAKEGVPWLSFRSPGGHVMPLPWQYPIAVVIDMIRMRLQHEGHTARYNPYPLDLEVHFSEPKATTTTDPVYTAYMKVLKLPDLSGGFLFLRSLLKRSMMYACGTAIPLLQLELDNPDYYTEFFEGIQENDVARYWRGRCALRYYTDMFIDSMGSSPFFSESMTPQDTMDTDATTNGTGGSSGPLRPPRSQDSAGDHGTGDGVVSSSAGSRHGLLSFPVLLHCEGTTKLIRWKQNGQKLGQFLKEHVPWLDFLSRDDIFHRHDEPEFILVQGISPLLSSPMEDLYDLLGSSDLFLHMVIRPMFVQQTAMPPSKGTGSSTSASPTNH